MEINANNINMFDSLIKKEPMVVFYYASWCGHCISFKPTWDSFVTMCKKKYPKVKLAKVESEVIPSLKYNANVHGYPTVKFYNKDVNEENNDFSGERSTDNLIKFVEDNCKKHGINLSKKRKSLKKKKSLKKRKSLNDNKYTVFGASWCVYCKRTKELLDSKGLKYKYYDIEDNKNSKTLKKYKSKVPSHLRNMIPIIFKNNKYIEGYSGLLKILE